MTRICWDRFLGLLAGLEQHTDCIRLKVTEMQKKKNDSVNRV
jgi:hypothetical protein